MPPVPKSVVDVVAKPAGSAIKNWLANAGIGITGASALDWAQHPDSKLPWNIGQGGPQDRWRVFNGVLNAGLYGAVRPLMRGGHSVSAFGAFGAPYAKDLLVKGNPLMDDARKNFQELSADRELTQGRQSVNTLIGAGTAAGALGLGAMGLYKYMQSKKKEREERERGRLRVVLPTNDPADGETSVDMPMPEVPLSNAMLQRVQRDVRKRLRSETKERTMKVDPETHKMIPFDKWKVKYGAEKAASARLKNILYLANKI
jgi:hypothetical protein